jgi:hypothetical protein
MKDNLPPLNPVTAEQMKLPIEMHIDVLEGLSLLGALQLSLRHPNFKKTTTAKFIDAFARSLQETIVKKAPGLEFLCEAGWNERFDR